MFDSPPANRTRRKAADKLKPRRSLSVDCDPCDNESKHQQTQSAMAPPASEKLDSRLIEDCMKRLLTKDAVIAALAEKLSQHIKTAVQEAVDASLKPLNLEVSKLKEQVGELTKLVKRLDGQLKCKTDDLQQYQRRNNLRVFGIPEKQGEDTDELIVKLCEEKLDVGLPVTAICRSHRVGKKTPSPHPDGTQRHRPIIVKFVSYRDRRRVFAQKKRLKESGITIREDLTAVRLEVFRRAAAIFGGRNTWTTDGRVMWIGNDGRRGSATRLEDLPEPIQSDQ